MSQEFKDFVDDVRGCGLCTERFAGTHSAHVPRPVVWLSDSASVLIVGQAPGARVHASGKPFTDLSGDRLRDWMGVDETAFYDRSKFAILPMAFCFPGYNAKGSDLPPPPICAKTWRSRAMDLMPSVKLTLVIGGYAQKWHLKRTNVTETVQFWQSFGPDVIPLPHPSWRNTAWLKKNPWFEADLVPVLQARIAELT